MVFCIYEIFALENSLEGGSNMRLFVGLLIRIEFKSGSQCPATWNLPAIVSGTTTGSDGLLVDLISWPTDIEGKLFDVRCISRPARGRRLYATVVIRDIASGIISTERWPVSKISKTSKA